MKVHITTQGCSSNVRESELMGGLLKNAGYDVSHENEEADVYIVNACTVKRDGTPLKAVRALKKQHPGKKIIVTGCITDNLVPQVKELDNSISFVNTHNLGKISTVVEQSLEGQQLELLDKKYESKVNLPSVRKNPVIGIVPILNGCNSYCTFCSTKLVKGRLFSYPIDSIKEDVKRQVQEGCKEIWITSNDTGAYMVDQGGKPRFIELMNTLLSIPLDFKIRIGMMNPWNTLNILDELIDIYKHPKMLKFLHIPLQAGNDEVLKGMSRKYTVEEFKTITDAFRQAIPDITLSTDIIVGFPGETEEQFEDTLQVMRDVQFDVMNLSRFSPREGTVAAKMKQFPQRIVKERSRKLTQLAEQIVEQQNKQWLGWKGTVLIDEEGKHDSWVGRNHAYKPVILKGDFKLGDEVEVEIVETTIYDLRAQVLKK